MDGGRTAEDMAPVKRHSFGVPEKNTPEERDVLRRGVLTASVSGAKYSKRRQREMLSTMRRANREFVVVVLLGAWLPRRCCGTAVRYCRKRVSVLVSHFSCLATPTTSARVTCKPSGVGLTLCIDTLRTDAWNMWALPVSTLYPP